MANGGKREGAGKPKGYKAPHTIATQEARKYVVERIVAELEPIMDKHIELAKSGDATSLKYLTDQLIGKAKETIDVESTTRLLLDE